MRRFVVVVFAAVVFSPCVALAQSIAQPRTWTATPFLNVAGGTSAPTGSAGFGAAVAYDWTSNLGFEGEIAHLFDVAGTDDNVDWSVTNVSANVVYHFDVVRVTPYATAGVGFERSSVHVDHPDPVALIQPSGTEVALNFGGGAKYPISSQLLVRADFRRFQANDLAPDYWRLYGGLTFTVGH
jgi:opacity protein-like surface antigen